MVRQRKTWRHVAASLALAFLWTTAARAQETLVNVQAGGLVSLDSKADTALAPMARVLVSLPLAKARPNPQGAFPAPPVLHLQADFTAEPGQTVALEDPETFRALEFRGGLAQRIHLDVNVDLYAEAGFATRLPGGLEARDGVVYWAGAGLRIGRPGEQGWLAVLASADQRIPSSDPRQAPALFRPALGLSGAVRLYEGDRLLSGHVWLVGEAVLAFAYGAQPQHASVRAGLAVGR